MATIRARRRERLASETAEEKERRLAPCWVLPARPGRHATSRCTTCSATSGDWRLKHLPWEEGNTYSSGPAQAKERETHLAQGQLSNQGLKHQRWGKDVLSTSDSANSVSTDKDYKSNKFGANAVFNFQLKATPYLWTVVYSDLKLSPFQYNYYVLSFS